MGSKLFVFVESVPTIVGYHEMLLHLELECQLTWVVGTDDMTSPV